MALLLRPIRVFSIIWALGLITSRPSLTNAAHNSHASGQKSPVLNPTKKWISESRLSFKAGNLRSLGQIAVMHPLYQDQSSLLFIDTRFMHDSKSNKEGNFGGGYRTLKLNPNWIFGGYAFFDRRRSRAHNTFHQLTVGTEAFNETWEVRLNAYLPLSHARSIKNDQNQKMIFRNHNIYTTERKEAPMGGVDLEGGRSVPGISQLSLYLGGYHFQRKSGKNITGVRVRTHLKITPYFSVTAEYQKDKVRHHARFIGLSIRIPLGKSSSTSLTALEKCMTNEIIRDIDIVTYIKRSTAKQLPGKFLHVKKGGNPSGKGTVEDPIDTQSKELIIQALELDPSFTTYVSQHKNYQLLSAERKLNQLKASKNKASGRSLPETQKIIMFRQKPTNPKFSPQQEGLLQQSGPVPNSVEDCKNSSFKELEIPLKGPLPFHSTDIEESPKLPEINGLSPIKPKDTKKALIVFTPKKETQFLSTTPVEAQPIMPKSPAQEIAATINTSPLKKVRVSPFPLNATAIKDQAIASPLSNGDQASASKSSNSLNLGNQDHIEDTSVNFSQDLGDSFGLDTSVNFSQVLTDSFGLDTSVNFSQDLGDSSGLDTSVNFDEDSTHE